jgi:hypothetical protein
MDKSFIINTLKVELPMLERDFGVKRIGLFGSFVNEKSTSNSDIDLLIEFKEPIGFRFFKMADYLEDKFHRKIDILTPAGIKSIRIKEVADRIMKEVEYVKA